MNDVFTFRPYAKSAWLLNRSDTVSYDIALYLDRATTPVHNNTGFFTVEYPRGNISRPRSSLPIVLHWVPNVVVGQNAITVIETPLALDERLFTMPPFSHSAVAAFLSQTITPPDMDFVFHNYGANHVVRTTDVPAIPILPLGHRPDSFLRRVTPCDATGGTVDCWCIPLATIYPPHTWFSVLTDIGDRFIEAPVYVKNNTSNDMVVEIDLERSLSHPLYPLCDAMYPAGNIVPANDILLMTVVFRVHGTFTRLGYMNLKSEVVLVPYLNCRRA